MSKKQVPHRIYLTEEQMPKQWYNLRADMKDIPPLLNPGTKEPFEGRGFISDFCERTFPSGDG